MPVDKIFKHFRKRSTAVGW